MEYYNSYARIQYKYEVPGEWFPYSPIERINEIEGDAYLGDPEFVYINVKIKDDRIRYRVPRKHILNLEDLTISPDKFFEGICEGGEEVER